MMEEEGMGIFQVKHKQWKHGVTLSLTCCSVFALMRNVLCYRFNFYDGPPFATGLPHYGHILAGTIKDIVTRFAHQSGFHVERRFGWDCHGLPVVCVMNLPADTSGGSSLPVVPCLSFIFLLLFYLILLLKEKWKFLVQCVSLAFVCDEFRSFLLVIAMDLYLFGSYFRNWCLFIFLKKLKKQSHQGEPLKSLPSSDAAPMKSQKVKGGP